MMVDGGADDDDDDTVSPFVSLSVLFVMSVFWFSLFFFCYFQNTEQKRHLIPYTLTRTHKHKHNVENQNSFFPLVLNKSLDLL